MAFFNLKNHYLGPSNVDNMSTQAEQKLQTLSYAGEGRRWNMERYATAHTEQHNILHALTEHGYSGIDERSKVRHFLNGIKSTALDPVKAQVMSSAALRQDFTATVNLFQDFIAQNKSLNDKRGRDANVSSLRSHKTESQSNDITPDMSVEDRYYNKKEYAALSAAKKKGLQLKRKARGHKPGEQSSKRKKTNNASPLKLTNRQIASIVSALKNSDDTPSATDEDDIIELDDGNDQPNRSNPALQRRTRHNN